MNQIKIPLLKENDVELRVQQVFSFNNQASCLLLVYKNARVDMRVLDEAVGALNWKRDHEVIKGNLFCTVSIKNTETGEWISKQDVGIESNADAQKGEASDAFKRACTNWGIGRELYAAPTIFIKLNADEVKQGKNGKPVLKSGVEFTVSEMKYNKEINKFETFTVVDKKGVVRFKLNTAVKQQRDNAQQNNTAAEQQKQGVQSSEPQTQHFIRKGQEILVLSQNGNLYPMHKLTIAQLQQLINKPDFSAIKDNIINRINELKLNTAAEQQKQGVQVFKDATPTTNA